MCGSEAENPCSPSSRPGSMLVPMTVARSESSTSRSPMPPASTTCAAVRAGS
ncbi:hypothetical protein ACFFX0_01310 [Citricoccus parietis]|uniref:Sema domain-containing protein n=1 Tax=Citricoccus parietis TaxID=592307 RepID=A0ABV5FT89_9MICC